ncbi:MAG: hypothetical protein ABR576_00195 [Thermoanaerobaculia bacterium]
MTVSQALVLEELLEGKGYAKKPGGLLSGLEGKLRLASELSSRSEHRVPLPTGAAYLDGLLQDGLPKGKLVELVGRRSSGRFSLGIAALATQTSRGEAAALVDLGGNLDPALAEVAGVDLRCLFWARPRKLKDALASAEMLLATGFPLVVLDLGLPPVRGERYTPDAAWVRLARAAQTQDAALLVSSPFRMSGIAAEVVLSAGTGETRWQGGGASPRLLVGITSRLRLEKDSHSRPGGSVSETLVLPDAIPSGAPAVAISNESIRLTA